MRLVSWNYYIQFHRKRCVGTSEKAKIRERSADLKAISFVVIIWVLAATVISFLAFIVIQTGMELAAADVLIAFIFVFFFWAVLVYVLTGEWPVHLSWIIPKKK